MADTKLDVTFNLDAGSFVVYKLTASLPEHDNLTGWVTWSKTANKVDPEKDIAVNIITPDGLTLPHDDEFSSKQMFYAGPPLAMGDYQIVLKNVGSVDLKGARVRASIS